MDLGAYLLLSVAVVLALLVPPYVVGRLRMARARSVLAHDQHVLTGFTLAAGGARPVLIYLGALVAVLVISLVIAVQLAIRVEPLVAGNWEIMIAFLVPLSPPVLAAVILIGMLISLAATGRARSRYLDALARERPDLSHVAVAAEHLRGGRGLLGVAGTAAIAAVACLALGLGWVALLFSVAGGAIQCARSSKCL